MNANIMNMNRIHNDLYIFFIFLSIIFSPFTPRYIESTIILIRLPTKHEIIQSKVNHMDNCKNIVSSNKCKPVPFKIINLKYDINHIIIRIIIHTYSQLILYPKSIHLPLLIFMFSWKLDFHGLLLLFSDFYIFQSALVLYLLLYYPYFIILNIKNNNAVL